MITFKLKWQKCLVLLNIAMISGVPFIRAQQRVGIGTLTPVSTLNLIGGGTNPTIPGSTSTGIFRIGISAIEGLDMGKMAESPFSGWLQAGYDGFAPDPLSLQPNGGNVGIGTTNPSNKLSVIGNANVTGTAAIGTMSPNASAQLDVSSVTKGFLPPRMTFAQRNSIPTPVGGLMIWCTNCGVYGQIQVYNGFTWRNMIGGISLGIPQVGDHDGGGVVAYILQSGDPGYIAGETHGFIAAPQDQSEGAGSVWGCYPTNLPGAEGIAIGTGPQNTIDIINACSDTGIPAKVCSDFVLDGYSDWYLPSKNELNKLYLNKAAIGGFTDNVYWSSSEADSLTAWRQQFSTGIQSNGHKGSIFPFRAIRSF